MWGSPDLAGSGENNFHPIVHLPEEYWVLNLQKPQTQWNQHYEFTIGRYDEDRKGMYTQALFGGERTIHVGLDIGGPAQTSIYAFEDGIIHSFTDNDVDGSYGPTIITQHELLIEGEEQTIWVLHGHLSRESLHDLVVGNRIKKGDQIGTMGDEHENGGWPPHVHIQLSLIEP
ncbi:MAG: peptidoglycan DD-metalloendopeptidase family protein, partial [Candidatus Poseidoniaceae archaeon]